ncbi:MAG TPA: DMT family transporter [Polyangia bacterium]|nr:DMT family transporter [Polyangia bacterium]
MLAGVLLGLGASACWALANVAIARAGRSLGSLRALLWSQLVGAGLAALASAAVEQPNLTLHALAVRGGWIGVACASSLLAYVCMFYAFEHGRLTIAVPIMSSWAVIAAAISLVLFHERLGRAQLGGAAAVIAGALVVSRYAQAESARASGGSKPRWLFAAAGAAIGFGVLIPAIARLVPAFGSIGAIGVVYVGDIVLGLPLALAFRIALKSPAGAAWLPVLAAGLFETAGFVCITVGSRFAPVALVSPFASLASALTVLYAWTLLRERPARAVLLGAALVCAGVVVLAL